MGIIIVIFAIIALSTANQLETKEKRQIQYTSVPTQFKQLSHGYKGQREQPAHQIQYYQEAPASKQLQQQTASAQLKASGEEIPPEYYNAIKEFAENQAEHIQRQQLEMQMKELIQQAGGRVVGTVQLPQTSESAAAYVQLGHSSNRQLSNSGKSKQQYARLTAHPELQQRHQTKYGFTPEQISYESPVVGQQQVQYAHVPQGQQYSSFSGHPLASSTLEKEIAKLESSFQSQIKAQPQPEYLNLPKAQHFTAQPHQNQFAYLAPSATKYQSTNNYQNHAQSAANDDQFRSKVQPEASVDKNQYVSEVHRFYNQPPKPINQQQQTQRHYYAAQQNPSKVQYVSTEKPVEEEQEIPSKFDTSLTMKIIAAPQLQYETPSKYQQVQPIAATYYNQYKGKTSSQSQELGPESLHLFKSAVHGSDIAGPSRSSIFVSQSTGAPPTQQYNKPQAQQQYQLPSFHQQTQTSQQQQEQAKSQHQSVQQVRLPPPKDGRPLTQDEFQALVDAGYSVTAIPVPVPVSPEQYRKHQQQQNQRRQNLNLQHEAPNGSYDISDERQTARSNRHATIV